MSLERRTSRAGKDSIDSAQGRPEDVANAVSGALVLAAGGDDAVRSWLRSDFSIGGSVPGISPPPQAATPVASASASGDVIEFRTVNGVPRRFNCTRRCWVTDGAAMPADLPSPVDMPAEQEPGTTPAPDAPPAYDPRWDFSRDQISTRFDFALGREGRWNMTRKRWQHELLAEMEAELAGD